MESQFCKKVGGVYIADARRPKPPCDYETMIFFADKFEEISKEFRAQAKAHEKELKGDYPLNTGIRIYDSLYDGNYWPVKNLADFMAIAHQHYPDVTGHE